MNSSVFSKYYLNVNITLILIDLIINYCSIDLFILSTSSNFL